MDLDRLFPGLYGKISQLVGIDPNAGLTAYNLLLVPPGGRYYSMSGAYTALAWDSGFIEANPAGSATLEHTELSFLHNDWIVDSNLESVVYTRRLDNLGFGFSGKFLYVPFTGYDSFGSRATTSYYAESIASTNLSGNFFSNYYFYGLSAGINAKAALRYLSDSVYPGQTTLTPMADVGVLTRVNFMKFYSSNDYNFSLGLAVKNLGPPAIDDPLPSRASAGIAWSPFRPWTLSADFNYPFLIGAADGQAAERFYVNFGTNVTVTDFFALQSGFQLKTGLWRLTMGSVLDVSRISFAVTYALDLATDFTPLNRMSIEARLNLGDEGRERARKRIRGLYLEGLEAYYGGNTEKAIRLWEEVLELDPTYIPASEGIKAARKDREITEELKRRAIIE